MLPWKSLFSRLGYLLDEIDVKNTLEKKLKKHIPKTNILLNPTNKTSNEINKKWKVIVNDK